MGVDLKSALKNGFTRVLLTVLIGYIFLLIGYSLTFYHLQINTYNERESAKLTAIAKTISSIIDADKLHLFISKHSTKDYITTNEQDSFYSMYHKKLNEVKKLNGLDSDIYTILFDEEHKMFFFGLSSSQAPHYFHSYKTYPSDYPGYYKNGGHFGPYKDKHGTWISSLAPIKTSDGTIISSVQVDLPFDKYIMAARKEVLTQVAYLSLFLIVLGVLIIRTIIKFLREEELQKEKLKHQHYLLTQKNALITSSINYAQRIQEAILPTNEDIKDGFEESFVLFLPKDTVSGDFYFYSKRPNKQIYFAAADCTGHGVPGAMMSMINTSLLNSQINADSTQLPGEVLNNIDDKLKAVFRKNRATTDGMDLALCQLNMETRMLAYAGAYRPLIIIRNNEMIETKGDRLSIGSSTPPKNFNGFITHQIQLEKGDCLYLFSDGYVDQFGGREGKKFLTRKLKKLLLDNHHLPMNEQHDILHDTFQSWKGQTNQIDDVVVFGIKITN